MTSSLAELLARLAGRGVTFRPEGTTTLRVEADPGTITPGDLETLRRHKPAILNHLDRLDLAASDAAHTLVAIRKRITWGDHLHFEDGRDARPSMLAVLEEYARLAEQARERFDAARLTEITEGATAFAARWAIVLPQGEAA